MSWIVTGAILFLAGKIIHSSIVEQLGLALIVVGAIFWLLGFIGISLALPFGL